MGQKSSEFPRCYSQSPLLLAFTLSPLEQSGLKLVCKVNIVYKNFMSENSQDYAQKPQRNCTFMNSASGWAEITMTTECTPENGHCQSMYSLVCDITHRPREIMGGVFVMFWDPSESIKSGGTVLFVILGLGRREVGGSV